MFEFKIHYEKGPDGQPVMEEVTVTNDDGEKVKEMRPKVLLNERVELLRLILGATLRNKDFFLAGFEKLLSPAGKATLAANRERCVGMAANMIGVKKRAIIVSMGLISVVMFNPVITRKDGPYEAEEGCLSLTGVRKTTRYEAITLEYIDVEWKRQRRTFTGWTAQIIQHEVDHLEGILI